MVKVTMTLDENDNLNVDVDSDEGFLTWHQYLRLVAVAARFPEVLERLVDEGEDDE